MVRTKIIKLITVNLLLVGSLLLSKIAIAEQFSIVVIPDTQNYTQNNPAIFNAQTRWIRDNRNSENIVFVTHLGDLTGTISDYCGDAREWRRVDAAMSNLKFDPPLAPLPYSVLPGNHDFDDFAPPRTNGCNLALSNNYNNGFADGDDDFDGFGPERFNFLMSNYGNLGSNNNNNFVKFSSPMGGVDFIAINLAFSPTNETAILDWADMILKQNSDRRAIITSHYIVNDVADGACPGGNIGTYGRNIVSRLVAEHPNIFMVLSGHCFGENWITYDNTDPQRMCMAKTELILSNYQQYNQTFNNNGVGNRDTGFMRIIRINTDSAVNNVGVETYSPWIDIPDAHSGSYLASGTAITDPETMGQSTVSNFNFSHDFNTDLSPSVVVLLDTSGSMAWSVEGVAGVPASQQRITFARQSIEKFLILLSRILDNPQKVQFGLVGFPHSTSSFIPSAQILAQLTWLDEDHRDTVMSTLAIMPNGSTPMLTGIEVAADQLEAQFESCKSVVLLSDGYHNNPTLASVGSDEVNQLIDSIDDESANHVPIHAISFGRAEDVDTDLLTHLASQTGGEYYDATLMNFDPAIDLDGTFKNVITSIFSGEVQMGVDPLDTIKLGETKEFEMPINEHDTRASFFISWRTLSENLITVRLFDSSDNEVALDEAGIIVDDGETYKIITVDDEALRAYPGRIGPKPWRVELEYRDFVIESQPHGSNAVNEIIEPIQYSVLLRSGLKFQTEIDAQTNAAGDKITLTAKLTQGRRPIRGLKNISVKISAPSDGRGNWLSTNHVSADQLRKVPSDFQGEFRPDHARKAIYLTDIAGIEYPLQKAAQHRKLYDDGTHGDHKANDGVYTTRFHATKKAGLYSFHFQAKGKTLAGNHFSREAMVEKQLSVRANSRFIVVKAYKKHKHSETNENYKKYTIKITPRDAAGNFVGPGHAGIIRMASKHGKFMGPVRDLLNGSYSQMLRIPKSTREKDVIIRVKVGEARKLINLARAIKVAKPPIEE